MTTEKMKKILMIQNMIDIIISDPGDEQPGTHIIIRL
jgi:hypothetical protein